MKSFIVVFILLISLCTDATYSQLATLQHDNYSNSIIAENLRLKNRNTELNYYYSSFLIGFGVAILLANPVYVYEDKHSYFGMAKEISVSYGRKHHLRNSFEYMYVFSNPVHHRFMFSFKYDFFKLPDKVSWDIACPFLSIGVGYYADKERSGIFPEVSSGVRIQADYLLFQPFIKLRHTFMFDNGKPSVTDISLGAVLGYIF